MKQFKYIVYLTTWLLIFCSSSCVQTTTSNEIIAVRKFSGTGSLEVHAFRDLKTGLLEARKSGRPLLVIFSGWALGSPDFEWRPLEQYAGLTSIARNYVIVWLAVDSRRLAGKDFYKTYRIDSIRYQTEGQYNMELQRKLTNSVSQPVYCVMDTSFKALRVLAYTRDSMAIQRFIFPG
jgi:hypothetical protein